MDSGQLGLHPGGAFKFQILIKQSNREPHQQIKWAGNGDGSNARLGVRWALEKWEQNTYAVTAERSFHWPLLIHDLLAIHRDPNHSQTTYHVAVAYLPNCLLDLPQPLQKIPEPGLCRYLFGGKDSHAVASGVGVLCRGDPPPNHLVLLQLESGNNSRTSLIRLL